VPADDLTDSPLWLARYFFEPVRRRAIHPRSRRASSIRPPRRARRLDPAATRDRGDRRFDGATDAAVRAFQGDNDLVSDGVIGPRTFAYMARRTSTDWRLARMSSPKSLHDVAITEATPPGEMQDAINESELVKTWK
jgi:hypothetical protein